jgi:hypothetical protein
MAIGRAPICEKHKPRTYKHSCKGCLEEAGQRRIEEFIINSLTPEEVYDDATRAEGDRDTTLAVEGDDEGNIRDSGSERSEGSDGGGE